MRLQGKTAVITGGARGIGKAVALRFLQEGAKVAVGDYRFEGNDFGIAYGPDRLLTAQADVTSTEQVESLMKAAVEAFGRIDVLINNAGITSDGLLTKMDEAEWKKVVDVNLTGVFKCTKAAVSYMIEQGSGVILNASSVIGVYGNVGQTNYSATKAGVIGMTKTWAKELGPKGIRVNAVTPGFIATDMTAKVPQKVLDLMESKTPLRRLGRPEDIASAYLFLASDEASFINGAVLGVDGGLVI